jgi:hypothetical protein
MSKTKTSHRKRIDQPDPARITQCELSRFLELTEMSRERDRLRKDILQRMELGAEVEAGRLTTSLTITQTRKWTKELVAQVIGWREVKHIWNLLKTTPYRRLRVTNRNEENVY